MGVVGGAPGGSVAGWVGHLTLIRTPPSQKVLTLVNMGGDNRKAALSFLGNALGGSWVVRELGISTPPWSLTQRAVAENEHAISAAARRFYEACLELSLPEPTLRDLILFHARKRVYVECRQYLPADYAFYDEKSYYYGTKRNLVGMAVAKAIAAIMVNMMKDRGPGNIPWPAVHPTR